MLVNMQCCLVWARMYTCINQHGKSFSDIFPSGNTLCPEAQNPEARSGEPLIVLDDHCPQTQHMSRMYPEFPNGCVILRKISIVDHSHQEIYNKCLMNGAFLR